MAPLLHYLTVSTPPRSVALPLRLAPTRPTTTTRLYTTASETTKPLDPYTPYVRARNFALGTATLAGIAFLTSYYFDSRAAMHRHVLMPLLLATTDPETAHQLAVWALKWGLTARDLQSDDEILAVKVNGSDPPVHLPYHARACLLASPATQQIKPNRDCLALLLPSHFIDHQQFSVIQSIYLSPLLTDLGQNTFQSHRPCRWFRQACRGHQWPL